MSTRKQNTRPPTTVENFQAALNMVQSGWKPLAPEVQEPSAPVENKNQPGIIGDAGRAVMGGLAGLVKTGGDLYGLASGNMDNFVSNLGDEGQKYWETGQSDELKKRKEARKAAIDSSDGIVSKAGAALWETISDPRLAIDTVASNAASLVPGAAVGRVASTAKYASGLRAGLTTKEAATVAGTVGTLAAKGTGAVQQGADVSSNTYQASMAKSDAQWNENPDFVALASEQLASNGGDMAAARQHAKEALSLSAARAAFIPAAAISVAANSLPGADTIERTLVGKAARDTIREGAKYGVPKAIIKGGLGEALGETIEEGGGQFTNNVAKQRYVDPNQDLSQDVGENAGMGAAGGLLMGGGHGVFHRENPTTQLKPQTEVKPQLLPETGSLSKAANAGITAQADKINQERTQFAGLDPLIQAANGENPSLVRELQQKAAIDEINNPRENDGSPRNFNELFAQNSAANAQERQEQSALYQSIADDNQIAWSERSKPMPIEQAQYLNDEANKRGKDTMLVPHLSGEGYTIIPSKWLSAADQAQFTSLQQYERTAPVAAEAPSLAAQPEALPESDAIQSNERMAIDIADTDARVRASDEKAVSDRRNALLDQILSSVESVGKSPARLADLYKKALSEQGYINANVNDDEFSRIKRFTDVAASTVSDEVINPDESNLQGQAASSNLSELIPEKKQGSSQSDAKVVPQLPPELMPLAHKSKNATEFFKALNAAKIPVGSRAPLMAAFKALKNSPFLAEENTIDSRMTSPYNESPELKNETLNDKFPENNRQQKTIGQGKNRTDSVADRHEKAKVNILLNENQMHEQERPRLSRLRREGDKGVPAVDGEFRGVQARHGDEANSIAQPGAQGQQRNVLAGKLHLGDKRRSDEEQKSNSNDSVSRPRVDDIRVGAGGRDINRSPERKNGKISDGESTTEREVKGDQRSKGGLQLGRGLSSGLGAEGRSADQDSSFKNERRNESRESLAAESDKEESEIYNTERSNSNASSVGEIGWNEGKDSIGATKNGMGLSKGGIDTSGFPTPEEISKVTDKQKEAGNYKKGHVKLHGLDIAIENPQGSVRSGKDKDGTAWENTLPHHYGYIKGTVGADKDHIDTFIGNEVDSNKVFVVDQIHPDSGKFDEHKVMLGFNSLEEAKAAYQASYAKDWQGGKNITETTVEGFKDWLSKGKTKKPYAPIESREVSSPNPEIVPPGLAKARELKAKREAAKEQQADYSGKWFGSQEKADKFIADKGISDTHEVVKNDRRFEIKVKRESGIAEPVSQSIHPQLDSAIQDALKAGVSQEKINSIIKDTKYSGDGNGKDYIFKIAFQIKKAEYEERERRGTLDEIQGDEKPAQKTESEPVPEKSDDAPQPLKSNEYDQQESAPQDIPRQLSDINVKATVYDAETGEASMQDMPADQALKKVDDRIETLKSLLKCMGG